MKDWVYWRRVLVTAGVGVVLYFIVGHLFHTPLPLGLSARFELLVLALAAGIGGPWAGLATGFIGELLLTGSLGALSWSSVLACAFIGLATGFICRHMTVADGYFGWRDVGRFMFYSLLINLVASLAIKALMDIYVFHEDMVEVLFYAVASVGLNFIIMGVFGVILMWLASLVAYLVLGLYYGDLFETAEEKKEKLAKTKPVAAADAAELHAELEPEETLDPDAQEAYETREEIDAATRMISLAPEATTMSVPAPAGEEAAEPTPEPVAPVLAAPEAEAPAEPAAASLAAFQGLEATGGFGSTDPFLVAQTMDFSAQ